MLNIEIQYHFYERIEILESANQNLIHMHPHADVNFGNAIMYRFNIFVNILNVSLLV